MNSSHANGGAALLPLILPIEPREVRNGEVLDMRIRYTLCSGMKTLRHAVE